MKQHTHTPIKQVGLFILDKSGSMHAIREAVISGFNEYLNKMQKNKVAVAFNLTLFDDDCTEERYSMTPISKVKKLTTETFVPCGMTPLYDGTVTAIETLERKVAELKGPVAVSVVIMTDGGENASTEHDQKCLRDLIKQLEKRGNWTFAYMGANQDSYAVSGNIGIAKGNTINWQSNTRGAQVAFNALASASVHNVNNMVAMAASGAPMASFHSADFFSGGGEDHDS